MPRSILGSIGVVVVAASVLYAQQQAQFLMPMTDENGAPVATFSPADLAIFEDGKPAKILKVEPKDSPLRVTLALDNGREMGDVLVHVRAAAREFFTALPDGVEIALMTTAPQPRFTVRPTKDRAVVPERRRNNREGYEWRTNDRGAPVRWRQLEEAHRRYVRPGDSWFDILAGTGQQGPSRGGHQSVACRTRHCSRRDVQAADCHRGRRATRNRRVASHAKPGGASKRLLRTSNSE